MRGRVNPSKFRYGALTRQLFRVYLRQHGLNVVRDRRLQVFSISAEISADDLKADTSSIVAIERAICPVW